LREGKAGIFLPSFAAIPCLVEIFEDANAMQHLQKFTVDIAREVYGLLEVTERLVLKRESWRVSYSYHGVPVFLGGKSLRYKIVEQKDHQTDKGGKYGFYTERNKFRQSF